MVREFKQVEDADFTVPVNLQKTLRRYQKTGYRWLKTLSKYQMGGILADDMGLGKTIERDVSFKAMVREFKQVEDADFTVPVNLQKTLRRYQKTGYRWLKTLSKYQMGGILADDMGLGKTLQVISVLLSEKGQSNKSSLIVAPSSLIYN